MTEPTDITPTDPVKPCLCGLVRIDLDGEQVKIDQLPKRWRLFADHDPDTNTLFVETDCGRDTQARFAPGHDARYKSLMHLAVRHGGQVYSMLEDRHYSPAEFSEQFTPNLTETIMNPAEQRVAKPKVRGVKEQAVRARVGAKEYDGTIIKVGPGADATEQFHYTDHAGVNQVASAFTILTTTKEQP